jgi:uncharacterized protein YjiS (DUF1127 family)
MSGLARPSLINFQPSDRPRRRGQRLGQFGRWVSLFRLWRRRIHEREALARLTERELADFGASSADVYRELSTPFWHQPRH